MDKLDRLIESRFLDWRRVQLPEFAGGEGDVKVLFDGLSCLVHPDPDKAKRYHKKYPYWAYSEGEFYEALFDWFFSGEVIKWPSHATEKGIFRTKYICASCGTTLDTQEKSYQWFKGKVDNAKIPPLEIGVEVPMITCPLCGQAQVCGDPITDGATLNQLIRESMLAAFSEVDLVP